MRIYRVVLCCLALAAALVAAGCSGGHGAPPLRRTQLPAQTPRSVSPALIPAPPMAKTAVLPPSAMVAPKRPMAAVLPPSWTQLPGSASLAAAAPDGSLWVLSDQPAGNDKYIWHYANGQWTNISGLADDLSVGPDGTLYAVNSAGGTYAYKNGAWSALGGGATMVTAAADGSVYVLSNAGSGDRAIWRNAGGTWTQEPGAGVVIAASWDAVPYAIAGAGNVTPYGLWVLNASGGIYYLNGDGTYAHFPGAASAIAPTLGGGAYVLGYPVNAAGMPIYYYDLASAGWTAQAGAGTSLSSNSTTLYVVAANRAIYATPIVDTYANAALPSVSLRSIGPHDLYASGKMQAIAVNPNDTAVIYAAGGYGTYDPVANDTGVYGTADGGKTWTQLDNGLTDSIVNALWLDPKNPSVLLAGTEYGGIFRSTDAGASWSNVNTSAGVTQIVAAGGTLYATAYTTGILQSTDDGATWTLALSAASSALSLAVAPDGSVYAGFGDGSVMVLRAGTWSTAGTITSGSPVLHLAVDAANAQHVYACDGFYGSSGFFSSTDGGATWTQAPGLTDCMVLAADPAVSGTVYAAATDQNVSVSTDGGATWTPTSIWGDQRGLVIVPGSPETFVDGSDQGVEVCTGTTTCTTISTALSTNIVNSVTAAGSTVAVTMQDFPPAVTHDAGASWNPSFGFQEDGTLLLNPDGSGYCYGFDYMGFRVSTDGCSTFSTVASVPKPVQGPVIGGELVAVDRSNPANVYVTALSGVYASSDHGQTFVQKPWPYSDAYYGYDSAVAVSPTNGSHIMLAGEGSIGVTFDGGNTWTKASGGTGLFVGYPLAVAISPIDDNLVMLLSGGLLYRSTDGGRTFAQLATPGASAAQLRPLRVSSLLRVLYRRNPLLAILQSQSARPTPLPTFIAFDQKGAPPYLAMSTTGGVFVSTDYGTDWQLVSGGTIPTLYYTVGWSDGTLYAGSWGNGVLKSTAPLQ